MTERERTEEEAHPVAMLLPWYRTGKLKEEEHRQVTEHLGQCPRCQRELEELTWLRAAVGTAYAEQPGPSPGLFGRVIERIEAEASKPERARVRTMQTRPGRADKLLAGLRALYVPKWAPVLASALILAQLGTLIWLLNSSQGPAPSNGRVIERSVPRPVSRIQVTFQTGAPAREIERVIKGLKGRVVDGPLAGGSSYVLEVPVTDQADIAKVLNELRSQSGVVQAAEPASP